MLGYLHANSRPDITFAVSSAYRFTHSPKRSHEQALEQIGQYLKGTKDNGLIFKPKPLRSVFETDIFVDADFAGGWGHEDPLNPACVKNCTGYMIELMGCPVLWCSKLQSCIAASTMEAEYTALGMAPFRSWIFVVMFSTSLVPRLELLSSSSKLPCTKITWAHLPWPNLNPVVIRLVLSSVPSRCIGFALG
jgi:hypothetical protein